MAKKKSAAARIKGQGRTLIWVTPDEDQKRKIRTAAGLVGKPMSQFLLEHGLAAAEKILRKGLT